MAQRTWVDCTVLQDLGVLGIVPAEHGQFPVSLSLKYVTYWSPESQSAKPFDPGVAVDLK